MRLDPRSYQLAITAISRLFEFKKQPRFFPFFFPLFTREKFIIARAYTTTPPPSSSSFLNFSPIRKPRPLLVLLAAEERRLIVNST